MTAMPGLDAEVDLEVLFGEQVVPPCQWLEFWDDESVVCERPAEFVVFHRCPCGRSEVSLVCGAHLDHVVAGTAFQRCAACGKLTRCFGARTERLNRG